MEEKMHEPVDPQSLQQRIQETEAALESMIVPEADLQSVQAVIEDSVVKAAIQGDAIPESQIQGIQKAFEQMAQEQSAVSSESSDSAASGESPDLVKLVREMQEIVLTHEAQQYIKKQVDMITAEMQEQRLMGIHYTPEEVDRVLSEAIQQRKEPYEAFIRYSHQKMKQKMLGGTPSTPVAEHFMRQSGQHAAGDQSGRQQSSNLPGWMQAWLNRNNEVVNNPLRGENDIEPMDFNDYVRSMLR